jgi:hypothetical protein
VAYSVTDTVAIGDVGNAFACQKIRVIATAGFAASDVGVAITATQSGGGGGGGGGVLEGEIMIEGFSTEAKQDTIIGHVDGIETLLGTIDADTSALVVDLAAIEVLLGTIDADTGGILTAVQLLDNAVSGAGFNITQFGGAAVPIGAGLEATAVRVTLPTDGTGVVGITGEAATDLDESRGFLSSIATDIDTLVTNALVGGQEDQAAPDKGLMSMCLASNARPSAVSDDTDAKRAWCDQYGRSFSIKPAVTLATSNATPITTTTSVIAAPGANTHLVIYRLHASNSSATECDVSWANGAGGTQYFHATLPDYGLVSPSLDGAWHLSSNTALSLVLSAACSLDYTVAYEVVAD